jgi:hypothetical protein
MIKEHIPGSKKCSTQFPDRTADQKRVQTMLRDFLKEPPTNIKDSCYLVLPIAEKSFSILQSLCSHHMYVLLMRIVSFGDQFTRIIFTYIVNGFSSNNDQHCLC